MIPLKGDIVVSHNHMIPLKRDIGGHTGNIGNIGKMENELETTI